MAINLDPINTAAAKNIMPGLVDNFFKNDPLLQMLKAQRLFDMLGGPQFQENFLYAPMNGGFYGKGQDFDISSKQVYTGLTFTPRYAEVNVSEYLEDIEVEANSPNKVLDMVQTHLGDAALTMSAILAVALYKEGQSAGRLRAINGLSEALSDGTNASYDGSTYTSYGTQTRADVAPALNSPVGAQAANVNGQITYSVLERSYQSCVLGGEFPKLAVTSNRCMAFINENFQPQQRLDTTEPTIGWPGLKFKNNSTTIVQSQYVPSQDGVNDPILGNYSNNSEVLFWLNPGPTGDLAYLKFYTSTSPKFRFGFTGFKVTQNGTKVAGQILWSGNFTVRAPRLMRILFGITS